MSKYISKKNRQYVINRANRLCEYCFAPADFAFHPFCVDHIIAASKGGTNDLSNLAYSCQNCNSHKYNKLSGRDPLSLKEVPIFNPRTDNWKEHFTWNEHNTILVGRSAVGRTTVIALQMNLPPVINIRSALVVIGVFPPNGFQE